MEREQTLPEYLKRLRRACHYKQDYVADQLHIARQTYSHYETGRIRPPAWSLYRLAGLYGVSVEDLFAHTALGEDGSDREDAVWERQLLYYFQKLDERNKKDILSIIQVKIRDQEKADATCY